MIVSSAEPRSKPKSWVPWQHSSRWTSRRSSPHASRPEMAAGWEIPESEIELRFVASGGPGGQHANRSNTKVDATFNIAESPTMPEGLRRRVMERLGETVRVTVDDERSQLRNREIALERLRGRVAAAGRVEPPRRATKPTRGSKRRRIDAKRRRGEVKRSRQKPSRDD